MAFNPLSYSMAELVPHAEPMILLDAITAWQQDSLTAEVTLNSVSPFATRTGVPAYVGIEYMAQAIAAHGGVCERQINAPLQIGFLVGSRRYNCNVTEFPFGVKLYVHITEAMRADNGLCVFDCSISDANQNHITPSISASAALNVFQPKNAEAFLNASNNHS